MSVARTKPNYEFKARVIEEGFCDIEKTISKVFFDARKRDFSKSIDEYEKIDELRTASETQSFLLENHKDEYLEAGKINHAEYQKKKRLKDRIQDMVFSGPCLFLTLTFSDETLQNTTAQTRRLYVSRYLRGFGVRAIANIDFGKENGREHYHAVIQLAKIQLDSWSHGFSFAEVVRNKRKKDGSSADAKRLAKYVAKLTSHAIKVTTKRQALMYIGF